MLRVVLVERLCPASLHFTGCLSHFVVRWLNHFPSFLLLRSSARNIQGRLLLQKTFAGVGEEAHNSTHAQTRRAFLVIEVPLRHAPSLSAVDGELAEALDDAALPLPPEHHLNRVNHPNLNQSGG